MLEIIQHPSLDKYSVHFKPGQTIFLEGDHSKDIYILVSGTLELLKNGRKIYQISDPGEMVGEMSFLLDTPRTATLRAVDSVQLIRLPADKIDDFFCDFASVMPKIIKTLAGRLKETTQVAHGFNEFCDQLPDAVIMTDKNNEIIAWNKAAEHLHGRSWQEMKGQRLAEVFKNPEEYQQFVEDIMAGKALKEKILEIRHPDGTIHHVSTSTTILYDGHYNVAGYVFLSRNVTDIKQLEKKYRQIRNCLFPALITLSLVLVAMFVGLPSFSKGKKILDQRKQTFRERISQDSILLTENLQPEIESDDRAGINQILDNYFSESDRYKFCCIRGLALLNNGKQVIGSSSPKTEAPQDTLLGSSYGGIPFEGSPESRYKVLSLFRATSDKPMGEKGIELAYEIPVDTEIGSNWLMFQLDVDCLATDYGLNLESLKGLDFSPDSLPQ